MKIDVNHCVTTKLFRQLANLLVILFFFVSESEIIADRIALAEVARHDLIAFAVLNTPQPMEPDNCRLSKYEWKQHHVLIADKLQELERGEIRNLEIETPPRHGKSELAVRNFVPWHAGRHPNQDLLIVTATADLAREHGRDVRDYFLGAGYNATFGHDRRTALRSDSQSVDRLQLYGGAKIQFFGRGQIPRGVGGHGLIIDDIFKSSDEIYSEAAREEAYRNVVVDCFSRLNSTKAWKLIIGSRAGADDVQGRMFDPTNPHYDADSAALFTRLRLPALSEGKDVDPLCREKDVALWESRFSRDAFVAKRSHKSDIFRMDFQTQDQCNPRPEEGTWFKKTWLKTYKAVDLPKNLRIYVASDHAYRITEKNDSSCLLVVGIDPTGAVYVLPQTVWERCDTEKLADHIFRLVTTLKPAQWWAARDAISGSIMPFLRRRMFDEKTFFYIDDSIVEKKDLVARSSSIRGLMAMGMVHWPAEWPQWAEAENQLLSFPGRKDDLVAALAMLGMGMDKMVRAVGPEPDNSPKKGTFAWHSWGQNVKPKINC